MHVPTEISKPALNDLAKVLHGLRFTEEAKFRWLYPKTPVFETAADWVRMMESVFEESRLVSKLTKAARKKYRFVPCIGHWLQDATSRKRDYRMDKYPCANLVSETPRQNQVSRAGVFRTC